MELILPSLYTSILGLITFSFVLSFLILKSKPSEKKSPPEAGGAWPIIGHSHLLGGSKPAHETLGNMADKFGPAFTVRLGQFKALVVSRWDLAKECYTTNDLCLLSRPESVVSDIMSYDLAMFGFSPYGPYWRQIRKLISAELLSTSRLELLKHVWLSEIQMSTNELYRFWEGKKKDDAVVDMKQWFRNLGLNTITRLVAGKRYFGGALDGVIGKEAAKVQTTMKAFLFYMGFLTPADSVPFLRPFDIGGYQKDMARISKEMDELAEEWLKEHRRKKESGQSTGDNDFMDVMISTLEKAQIGENYDPDTIIKANCLTLISAIDTTAVALTWALALLKTHPEALRKVKEELNHHVGKERRLTDTDTPNLDYLQAVLKETLRLHTPAPLGGVRKFEEDATIGGYHIPKETHLLVNLWKMHRDPNVWDDPTGFKPERFLTTHKDFDVKGLNFELIPFSAGRRSCPAMYFALQVLPLLLGNVLHAFDFSIPADKPIHLKESPGLTNHIDGPLELAVVPCLPAKLF